MNIVKTPKRFDIACALVKVADKRFLEIFLIFQELTDSKLKLNELQNLAKKIVQTDILIRKYNDKERECEQVKQELK